MLVDAVASILILMFERHAHGSEITNIGACVRRCGGWRRRRSCPARRRDNALRAAEIMLRSRSRAPCACGSLCDGTQDLARAIV